MDTLERLYQKTLVFSVFDRLQKDPVVHAFFDLMKSCDDELQDHEDFLRCYAGFVSALYHKNTQNWTQYLTNAVLSLETCCIRFAAKGQEIPALMQETARFELSVLSRIAAMSPQDFSDYAGCIPLPKWEASAINLQSLYFERLNKIDRFGYGVYANYRMFRLQPDDAEEHGFSLKPVEYPDAVSLEDLIGYSLQRGQVIENTKVLLRGKKASNVLLYGDAGTGKSATVKAIANTFSEEGLRLIELGKDELHMLPKLLDVLSGNPLKFILFIDDLSFQDNDDDFSALKAVLEGSIAARSHNTVIYATSNRRHIVRETFSAREGDEVHRQDTMQETISLSERFGIKVYFEKPKKDLYLEIVYGLAQQYGLSMDHETLALEAERFALRKSGRSARAARQLIEQLSASVEDKE